MERLSIMRKIAVLLVVVVCGFEMTGCGSQEKEAAVASKDMGEKGAWLTDFDSAVKEARASGRMIFMDFTGSDWCPPCMMMAKEVLDTPDFLRYADSSLVLLKVDFPRRTQLPPTQEKANGELMMKFNPSGIFPTFVVLDPSGKVLDVMQGYQPGGPKAMIAALEKLK